MSVGKRIAKGRPGKRAKKNIDPDYIDDACVSKKITKTNSPHTFCSFVSPTPPTVQTAPARVVLSERATDADFYRIVEKSSSGALIMRNRCDCDHIVPPFPTCNWKCRISCIYHLIRYHWCDISRMNFPDQISAALSLINWTLESDIECDVCMAKAGFYTPCTCRFLMCSTCAYKLVEIPKIVATDDEPQKAPKPIICYSCRKDIHFVMVDLIRKQEAPPTQPVSNFYFTLPDT